jgi:hypothetical protein
MARQLGARMQVAFAFESVYGAPPASGDMPPGHPSFKTTILGVDRHRFRVCKRVG